MSIMKRNEMLPGSLFDDMLLRDPWNWAWGNNGSSRSSLPAVNIRETGNNFEVEMAAPGMKKEDFQVELDGNMLTISSEKQDQREEKEGERYTKREFSYQSFQRSFQLPKDVVDADHIEAKYVDGVLRLIIPKREEARQRPPRTISIS